MINGGFLNIRECLFLYFMAALCAENLNRIESLLSLYVFVLTSLMVLISVSNPSSCSQLRNVNIPRFVLQKCSLHRVLQASNIICFFRIALSSVFDEVVDVNEIDSGDSVHLTLLKRLELGVTFTKLHCWTLTQYSKCVFLDADTLVRTMSQALLSKEYRHINRMYNVLPLGQKEKGGEGRKVI